MIYLSSAIKVPALAGINYDKQTATLEFGLLG